MAERTTPAVHLQTLLYPHCAVPILHAWLTLAQQQSRSAEDAALTTSRHLQAGREACLLVDHNTRAAGIIHASCMGEAAQRLP